ncbi:MAG: hypothetical protein JF591_21030 [Lysobacter sp.]|nr:hypothetical protein [Lysobacter sp.]
MSRHYKKSEPLADRLLRIFNACLRGFGVLLALACLLALAVVVTILIDLRPGSDLMPWPTFLGVAIVALCLPAIGLVSSACLVVRGYRRASLGALLLLVPIVSIVVSLAGLTEFFSALRPG